MSNAQGPGARPEEPRAPSWDRPGGRSAAELLEFLTGVTHRLAASTEYEETLKAVAEQALPYLGSWCIVDLVEPDGSHRRLAIVHPDPQLQPHAERLTEGWPPERGDPLGLPRAVRARRSEVIPEIDDELLVRVARSEGNLRDLRALGIGSIVTVPLIVRDDVLGAMTFVAPRAGRAFGTSDVQLAEDLAARCAIAIHTARLFEELEVVRDVVIGVNERLVLASLRDRELAETATAKKDSTSRFLATLSHELRAPVNAIIGYTALLSGEISGPVNEDQRRHLDRIQEGAKHLIELLSDILDLKKIEEGRTRLEMRRTALRPVVMEALGMLGPLADEAGVEVEGRWDPTTEGVCDFVGDAGRVQQILLNLLINAVKFTGLGGEVRVTSALREEPDPDAVLSGDGPWISVEVKDTGIGIPASQSKEVFEAFVQLEGGARKEKGGAGLGLPISRELARRMGGDVTLRSEEGKGSRFTLWLPAAGAGRGPA